MTFSELGLAEPLLRAVSAAGYNLPTPIQLQAIPHAVAGRDLLGCAQTGTGKTAAFALPILHRLMQPSDKRREGRRRIRVLVLSPTRELAAQIAESFATYGQHTNLRQTCIYGGVGQGPQTRALQQGVDILIATPGRLVDLINQGFIDLASIETFVLDEADRMLDMGFLPDMRRIIKRLPTARQTLFFSATMPAPIEQLANAILRDPVRVHIAPVKATTELIEHSVYFVAQKQKPQLLADFLTTRSVSRALVFTRTKHGADRVARQLAKAGITAEAFHGNKSQGARMRTLANFKLNRTHVLIATDIAARGIDVDGISHVLNYDLPVEPETYVHRIGRTGRAGASGIAVSFCDHDERKHLKAIERLMRRTLSVEKHQLPDLPPAARTAQSSTRSSDSEQSRRPGRRRPARTSAGAQGSGRSAHGGNHAKARPEASARPAAAVPSPQAAQKKRRGYALGRA